MLKSLFVENFYALINFEPDNVNFKLLSLYEANSKLFILSIFNNIIYINLHRL